MNNVNKIEDSESEEISFKGVSSERSGDENISSLNDRDLLSIVHSPEHPDGTILIILNDGAFIDSSKSEEIYSTLRNNQTSRIVVLNHLLPMGSEVIRFAESVIAELERKSLKRITLIGIEDGASVVQALTILEPRLIRRAVLVNPNSRVNPTFFSRAIDWIEKFLPVGLPFRAVTKEFDSRPFVHRIRCPILIVTTPSENFYRVRESEYLANKIPNCYLVKTEGAYFQDGNSDFSQEFVKLFDEFQKSPVKRPQKNR